MGLPSEYTAGSARHADRIAPGVLRGRLRPIPAVFLFAFFIRLAYCLLVVGSSPGLIARLGDDAEYDGHARSLLAGRGMVALDGKPTAQRTPAYPLLLAGVYGLFGHSFVAVRVVHCLLGAMSCSLLYVLAREWFGKRTALIAAAILAVYPMNIWLSGVLLSENLTVPGLLLGLVLLTSLPISGSTRRWATAGAVVGCLGLIHPILAGLGAVLCGMVAVTTIRSDASRWRVVACLVVAFAVPPAGWMVRNRLVVGGWVISSLGGKTFLGANNIITATWPRERGYWVSEWSPPGVREQIGGVQDELTRDRLFFDFALRWLRDNPQYGPRLLAFKLGRFYLPLLYDWKSTEGLVYLAGYGTLLPFVVAGLWGMARRGWAANPLAVRLLIVVIVYYTVMVGIFWGAPRFRQTIEPLLILSAATALVRLADALWNYLTSTACRWQPTGQSV